MDSPSFQEAVRFAKAHLEEAEADSPRIVAEEYRMSPANRRPRVLALLLRRSAAEPMAWDAVTLIAEQLHGRGETLPRELNDWAVEATTGMRRRPTPRGRPPKKARNRTIVDVIKKLGDAGYHPTRNDATEPHHSGCDAVAVAFGLKYKTVESVWRVYTDWHSKGEITDAEYEWLGWDLPPS